MSFASNKYAREIRLEAALFIGSMCQTSLLTVCRFAGACKSIPHLLCASLIPCVAANVHQLPRAESTGGDDG